MQYAIRVIHPNGETKLLADHSGVVNFSNRERADRMTTRLAFSSNGDRYEVTKLPS